MAKLNYDSALAELNQILLKLQDETTNIEDISKLVKRAKTLSDFCKQRLREIEGDLEPKA